MEENPTQKPWGMDVNTFAVLMHLSQFLGVVIPLAGFILPIVMWVTTKDSHPLLNEHGKNIINCLLSFLIYTFICYLLMIILVGFVLIAILGLIYLIFVIIAAAKAGQGIVWRYPLTIQFIR
ncbi:DUF4870 domain-containing protein [Agitococcus lubricus]|uniref:Tic20 family protein n=1 Tax=Agitococcus lubricus TaxID=1077255 RepID=A0A2T5IZ50_9GAMM|nr:DUF4870 domain-containing protein [Agitococcus lubricus]PTQ89289.1 hypothetical protein C8N29_10717 [Agitococcus lubricus]